MARKNAQLTFAIDGLNPLIKSLAQFKSKTTAKRIMRGSLNKAVQVLVKAARKNAPEETGLLKKAITKDVRTKGHGMSAKIGADAKLSGVGPDGRTRTPQNYVHLVEYGFKHAKSGQHVPGARFIEKTSREHAPRVTEQFAAEVGERIVKELAKGKGKK
jgi:HK97 gp10 family phage protein